MAFEGEAEPVRALHGGAEVLVEEEDHAALAALGGRTRELGGDHRLAGAGRADDEEAGAGLVAAADQRVEALDAAREHATARRRSMLGRDQAREDDHAALANDVVVVAIAHRGL